MSTHFPIIIISAVFALAIVFLADAILSTIIGQSGVVALTYDEFSRIW